MCTGTHLDRWHVHWESHAQVHTCTDMNLDRYARAQVYLCTDTHMDRYACAQVHTWTVTHVQRYACEEEGMCTGAHLVDRYLRGQVCTWAGMRVHRWECTHMEDTSLTAFSPVSLYFWKLWIPWEELLESCLPKFWNSQWLRTALLWLNNILVLPAGLVQPLAFSDTPSIDKAFDQ